MRRPRLSYQEMHQTDPNPLKWQIPYRPYMVSDGSGVMGLGNSPWAAWIEFGWIRFIRLLLARRRWRWLGRWLATYERWTSMDIAAITVTAVAFGLLVFWLLYEAEKRRMLEAHVEALRDLALKTSRDLEVIEQILGTSNGAANRANAPTQRLYHGDDQRN